MKRAMPTPVRNRTTAKGSTAMDPATPDHALRRGPRAATAACLAGLMLAFGTAGCLAGPGGDGAFFERRSGREAVEAQLAGEALAQRKYSMRRVRRDLARFRTTFEQLQRHGKASGVARFERFARPYLERRVDPLVEHRDAVSHPELRPFHAELLLSKAVLMHQIGDRTVVRDTITRLEDEFASMTSMLVLYPTGEAVTLAQGIALLRHQTGVVR